MEGCVASALAALTPSAATETRAVALVAQVPLVAVVVQPLCRKICRVVPVSEGKFGSRFVACDEKAMKPPLVSMVGSRLSELPCEPTCVPLPAVPEMLASVVVGKQVAWAKQVSRTKISETPLVSSSIKLLEIEANATKRPVELIAGPERLISPMPLFA